MLLTFIRALLIELVGIALGLFFVDSTSLIMMILGASILIPSLVSALLCVIGIVWSIVAFHQDRRRALARPSILGLPVPR